ncbi:MAG TPA: curli production assembly/transport component CsgG [Phaeodactylibacter sp.]|nr:curli production assembly/transport component CsgG [Phaeodactylibacter sp.]
MYLPFPKNLLVFWLVFSLTSCGTLFRQSFESSPARLGEETQETAELKSLPPPKEKIIVAVYKFRDQTGQYKPAENGASWSTAVTQGATTILIKALEDSNWFIPIERENVGNLLNERKIIRSSREQYKAAGQTAQVLPPLLYAGVLIEGGIISYDANVITGGAGLRYFGAGASGQYRQDRVTVYLRAISTSNGKVLKTVYSSKTILSQAVDVGLFRFVRFKRLLEVETGFTYNEPSEMAVTEAIEKAVQSLIIEGIIDELWALKEPRMMADKAIIDYKKEKETIPQTDIFGKSINNRRKVLALHLGTGNLLYKGDYPNPAFRFGTDVGFMFSKSPNSAYGLHFGMSQFYTSPFYQAKVSYLEAFGLYRFLPYDVLSPFLQVGAGLITHNETSRFDFSKKLYPQVYGGLGIEYLFNKQVGLLGSLNYHYLFSDQFDQVVHGRYNDFYWNLQIGMNFYFGKTLSGNRKFDYNNNYEY